MPVVATGIEYKLSSGPHTFTESELQDAIKAQSDIAIKAPRLKLGHKSKTNELFLTGDEPAFGRVENLRLSENGQEIIGDYAGMPEWLATVMPTAYPARSVDASLDVETVTGKQYSMVITDVSALGVRWPGCSVLEDLPLWYGSEVPDEAEIDTEETIAASGGKMGLFRNKQGVVAAVDVSLIRRKFYNDGPGKDNMSWWIRGERFDTQDGYNLIVDQGDGNLSRIPVGVSGSDIEFGDLTPVTEEYPDKAIAAEAVLAGMKVVDPSMIIHASRAETDDRPPSATQEGGAMDEATRAKLVKRLGLPEDATEEQIQLKAAETLAEQPDPKPGEGEGEGSEGEGEGGDGSAGDGEGAGAGDGGEGGGEGAPSNIVTLDRATFESLQQGSKLAAEHERERRGERVAAAVDAAITDGKIPPARREHWSKLLEADYEGGKKTLDSLEKNVVPLKARGAAGGGDGIEAGAAEGLPESWFPEIKAIRAEADSGRRVLHAKEG